ncbi:hypothetical protein OHA10_34200 [Kribbella sp. NBC_00662]|uniref:hypothetical protein n=1 Tax=Kribbella sp. NBC_00662 TaxID=2975969 RepID=UPI003253E362
MTNDKLQPGLPVVEVDQAFPLMTTDSVARPTTGSGTGDQSPVVSAAIRDVLGWRPRVQDPKAFTAALTASFELSTFEDHVVTKYVPRGVAVQADLGGVTGGQASLYLRAKAAHEQITRMLDSLQPLRTDADPQDCEAYRTLVRDSVRRIVTEFGREGGPRVPLVDSAFGVLTGFNPTTTGGSVGSPPASGFSRFVAAIRPRTSVGSGPTTVPAAVAEIDPDSVPGQLGALRDRFGLDDDHVNTVDEEKQRTSFWTLVELVTDLQRSWALRRTDFTLGAGSGFLGTDLVQISRLLAAASEQVDEFEAVLDSVLVSGAERQTVILDRGTGLTLDDLTQWLRVFVTEDGPNIIRDTGRDGLVSTFTPTAIDLLVTLRDKLVRRLIPCGSSGCAGGCHCGSRGKVTCIPLGCCTPLPPGMYSGRVKIAVSTLCGLIERLTAKAIRIGRFSGVVLLDLAVMPFEDDTQALGQDFVRVEVRGLHLRPTYVPAFVTGGEQPFDLSTLVLPLQGSASGDDDHLSGIFQRGALPDSLQQLLTDAGGRGILLAASEVPLAIVDGELGRLVQGPSVTTWPRLRPAYDVDPDGAPDAWSEIPPNQRFVPQSPVDPLEPEPADDDCLDDCDDDCEDCGCGCHGFQVAHSALARFRAILADKDVQERARKLADDWPELRELADSRFVKTLRSDELQDLLTAVDVANARRTEDEVVEERAERAEAKVERRIEDLEIRAEVALQAALRARKELERAKELAKPREPEPDQEAEVEAVPQEPAPFLAVANQLKATSPAKRTAKKTAARKTAAKTVAKTVAKKTAGSRGRRS